jgi:hypothetical protein
MRWSHSLLYEPSRTQPYGFHSGVGLWTWLIIASVLLLRFASLLVLALWVGGLVALGSVAAPTIFAVLELHDPLAGSTLAGDLFGQIFQRFQHLTWILGGLLLALLGARAALGPRPRLLGLRMWTVTGMLAVSVASGLILAPRIDAIRRDTAGTLASLPATDPRKVEFGWLHGVSTALMLLTLGAGLGLIGCEARE